MWIYRAAALLLPVALLAIAEIGLRLGGYGFSTHFFLKSRMGNADVLTDNSKFGRWFFPPALARSAAPFAIPAAKPAGTVRIFILGESAAMGDPESAFSFSRILEVLLHDRYPQTRFEIVNTGITAINSHAILPIARDCAQHDGDFWILYLGNNEVVGPYGAGTVFGTEAPPLPVIRASLAAKSLRITQWLQNTWRRLFARGPGRWGGMQMFVSHQVPQDDPRMPRVYDHFKRNLDDILRAGMVSGVKQIVCTVGSNLKDCPPFASAHGRRFDPARQPDWKASWDAGVTAESERRWREAIDRFREAEKLDPDFAELQFRMGRCFLALDDRAEAMRRFERARDLDTLRFRADTRINQTLRETSEGRTNSGIYLVDTASMLAAGCSNGIPGHEMFYEHVHLTFEGNWVIARGVAEQIAPLLPAANRRGATDAWLSSDECARRLGWDEWSRYRVLREIKTRMAGPPFTGEMGHEVQMSSLAAEVLSLAPSRGPAGLQSAAQDYRYALTLAPDDPVLHNRLGEILSAQGDVNGAVQQWEIVARLLPQRAATFESLGTICGQANRPAEAQKYFARALALDPESAEAWNGLGLVFVDEGRFLDAVDAFNRGLRFASAGANGIRMNLARAMEAGGKPIEAERQYRSALAMQPDDLETLLALGHFLVTQQRPGEAREILERAVQADSRSVDAHLGLGVVLEQFGDTAEATRQFREVLKLDPDNPTAKARLAVLAKDR